MRKKNSDVIFFVKSELRKELLEQLKNTKFIIKFNRRVGNKNFKLSREMNKNTKEKDSRKEN